MKEFLPAILAVALLNGYALVLILLRAPIFSTKVYRPMLWNIWLSIIPVLVLVTILISLTLAIFTGSGAVLLLIIAIGGLAWLLMLPNAAYLVTELNFSHRRDDEKVPLWYDIVLVLTLALSGVANTLLNVFLAQLVFLLIAYPNDPAPMSKPLSWVMVGIVLLLVAFGIYLGRYLRFNSWDLRKPTRFIRKLTDHFSERSQRLEALGFTFTHAVLLGILYLLAAGPGFAALT